MVKGSMKISTTQISLNIIVGSCYKDEPFEEVLFYEPRRYYIGFRNARIVCG